MKILITGATGLIGTEIVKHCLQKNIDVNYLTTSKEKIVKQDNYNGFYWNPASGFIDINCLENVTTIINLAGASVSKRWTSAYKQKIIESRTLSLNVLYNALKNSKNNVKQLISASAIGIYPHSFTQFYTEENTEVDDSFLGKVVDTWEETADTFKLLNIDVAKVRIGLVLAKNGGMLPQIAKPIKNYVGTIFGNGKQYQSWIHIEDLVGIFHFIIKNNLDGVYNAVAPNPVTHKTFTKQLAKQLKKPILLPSIPKFVMKLILGEMSHILFSSQYVSSKKVQDAGFQFFYTTLPEALDDLC